MNDNETKVMTFTSVIQLSLTPTSDGTVSSLDPLRLLSGAANVSGAVTPQSGRLFFAGMMFDRMRFRSLSCTIRPISMPSSTATNYSLYASWDRYGPFTDGAVENSYSIQSDPSAKQVVWSSGGSGTSLRTYIYSTQRDKYQYFPIVHNTSLVSWIIPSLSSQQSSASSPFFPSLLLSISAITAPSTPAQISILSRVTIEFQGGYSNNTLNYSPPGTVSLASADSTDSAQLYSLTQRIRDFQKENPDE